MDGLLEPFQSLGLNIPRPPPTNRIDSLEEGPRQTRVPRYLFRVFTPRSDGETSRDLVRSRDHVNGHGTAPITLDVSECEAPSETAYLIWSHLMWKNFARDNLMSWTNSLLFAIQYAFYRHAHWKDMSAFRDINILVVDTVEFPADTFICDVDLINAFSAYDQDLASFKKLRAGDYYFGEFLSQGALAIRGIPVVVSAQSMIDAGLLELRADFKQTYNFPSRSPKWANEVLRMRQRFISPSRDVSSQEIEIACRVGRLFGRDFRLPIAIQLTALCLGHLNVDTVTEIFDYESEFDGEPQYFLLSDGCSRNSSSLSIDDERSACAASSSEMMQTSTMPELERARFTADVIYASYCQRKIQGP